MKGCLISVSLVIVVLVCGFYLPGHLISDGLDDFEGGDIYRARTALEWAKSDPDPEAPSTVFQAIFTTAYHVEETGRCENPDLIDFSKLWPGLTPEQAERELREEMPDARRDAPPDVLSGDFHYRVELFTVFGIPYDTKSRTCR